MEIEPHKIYYDNFYQSEEDAINAVNAVYDVLAYVDQYSSSLWLIQDIGSDDCRARATLNDPNLHQFNNYDLNSTNIYLAGVWEASYIGIGRANVVLDRVPPINMDSTLKKRLLGEARFLRALYYFNLVRMFGDVPLVLQPLSPEMTDEELYPARTDAALVYQNIIADLENAAGSLPEFYTSENKGRATKGASLAVLANVYLHMEEWSLAANYAQQTIDLGVYQLWTDYADNFKEANKNGMESVFEVQFYRNDVTQNSQMVISGLPSIQGYSRPVWRSCFPPKTCWQVLKRETTAMKSLFSTTTGLIHLSPISGNTGTRMLMILMKPVNRVPTSG
ncbi:MAG: RagB/SusD family nutrient uptake outer membrane protein [Bacteroidota bacterium]|nr:RagB/SusD family nutrient uptake outer membrane protein [Bacteroidota bacterium]